MVFMSFTFRNYETLIKHEGFYFEKKKMIIFSCVK